MLSIIEIAQPLCDGDVFRLCLHKRLSDHQLDDIVDIDGVVEEGLLILQLLATEEEPLAWEVDFHPAKELMLREAFIRVTTGKGPNISLTRVKHANAKEWAHLNSLEHQFI